MLLQLLLVAFALTCLGMVEASIISKECPEYTFKILQEKLGISSEMTFDQLGPFIQEKKSLEIADPPVYCPEIPSNTPMTMEIMMQYQNAMMKYAFGRKNNFDQNLVKLVYEISRYEMSEKIVQLLCVIIDQIPQWDLTPVDNNCSVLSILSSSSHFRGTLNRPDYMTIFEPYFDYSRYGKDSFVILHALALFTPEIQLDVMTKYIEANPSLKQLMLHVSLYYHLSVEVIEFFLNSITEISLIYPESAKNKSLKRNSDGEILEAVYLNYFINFEKNSFDAIEMGLSTNPDPKRNFMLAFHAPIENGSLRVAFEHYDANIVKRIVELSPDLNMSKYYLAFLIAFDPKKQSEYDPIESLVGYFPENKFDNLKNGIPDVVEIAILSQKEEAEIKFVLESFMRKTTSLKRKGSDSSSFTKFSTSEIFSKATGISRLPDDIDVLDVFFTACRWNMPLEPLAYLFERMKVEFSSDYEKEVFEIYYWAVENGSPIKDVLLEHLLLISKNRGVKDEAELNSYYLMGRAKLSYRDLNYFP